MNSTRPLFIVNPTSDRGRCCLNVEKIRPLVQSLAPAEWVFTEGTGHAEQLAWSALEKGFDRVVSVGGDGTVHEIINGLMKQPEDGRLGLGIVPMGSGNDFAFACQIPRGVAESTRRALGDSVRTVDIGHVTDDSGRSLFFGNSIGMLFDAAVNIQSHRIRWIRGFPMYLTATVRALIENHRPTRVHLEMDGVCSERLLVMMTLGNGPREGGGFMTTPPSLNNDGLFELLLVDPISKWRMFTLLPVVMRGKHLGHPSVSIVTCRRLVIETDTALPIHIDGELWADYEQNVTRLDICMHRAALRVY